MYFSFFLNMCKEYFNIISFKIGLKVLLRIDLNNLTFWYIWNAFAASSYTAGVRVIHFKHDPIFWPTLYKLTVWLQLHYCSGLLAESNRPKCCPSRIDQSTDMRSVVLPKTRKRSYNASVIALQRRSHMLLWRLKLGINIDARCHHQFNHCSFMRSCSADYVPPWQIQRKGKGAL